MAHGFEPDIAKEYSVDIAIMVNHFDYWLTHNKANKTNENEGTYWTYNSISAFMKIFPYWTDNQIRRIVKSMLDKDVIRTGNFNQHKYDRTTWYTFTDAFVEKHKSMLAFSQMEVGKKPNGSEQSNEPIPHDNQLDNQIKIPYTEIIDYLNEKSGSKYRNIKNTRDFIKARFNEGFTKEDFFKVIDNKVSSWTGSEFEKFIRPQTLFSPKFESYLNEKPIEKKHTGSKEGYQVDISKYDTL